MVHRRTTVALGTLVALATLALPVLAAGMDASKILATVEETYRGLTTYRFEASTKVDMKSQGMQQSFDVPVRLAGGPEGRMRVDVQNPMMGMVSVTDAESTWMYIPTLNQYTKKPAATPVEGEEGAAGAPPNLVAQYKRIAQKVQSARVLREETLKVEGKAIPSWVVEAVYVADRDTNQVVMTPKTYWIDKKRFLVLQEVSGSRIKQSPTGTPIEVMQTSTMTMVRVGEPVADSMFTFTPPTGAREVSDFEFPGQPKRPNLSGQQAAEFALSALDGNTVALRSLRGKVVLLDFWATWCGPCRRQTPTVAKLHDEFKDKGLVVLGVNVREDQAIVRRFLQKHGYGFPNLLDTKGEVADQYSAQAIPTLVVIDKEGKIANHFIGLRSEGELRAALKSLGVQ